MGLHDSAPVSTLLLLLLLAALATVAEQIPSTHTIHRARSR